MDNDRTAQAARRLDRLAEKVPKAVAAQPVISLMRDALLEAEVIHCDGTTIQVLKEKGRRPQTKSYRWAQMTVTAK